MPEHPKSKRVESGLIAGGIIVLVAVSGYFVGLRQTNSAIAMTRAVPVEITVDAALPPGVPADIRLTPCRTRGD